MVKLRNPSKYTRTPYWRPIITARPTTFTKCGGISGRIGTHLVSGSSGHDCCMNTQFHARGPLCLWRLYGGTSSEWSSTTIIDLVSTSRPMPWLLRESHHIGCALIGSSGTLEMDAPSACKESRSRSSVHGLLCTNARTAAHVKQTSSGGFAHAKHRSTTPIYCASTWSRLSPFLMLIGGQMSSGGTQHHFTTYANSFHSMSEKPLPALLLWARDIGLDKVLHRSSIPHLLLCRKFW